MLDLKSRLSRSYLHSSPNPSFDKGGACCKPTVCHLRCGDLGYSVDSVYYGLVVYAARLKWQGLVANPWFATYGVGMLGIVWIVCILCILCWLSMLQD